VGVDPDTGLPQVSLHQFDVVDADGNPVNDKPLHPRAAGRLLAERLAEAGREKGAEMESNQDAQVVEQKVRWRKIGGGSFRMRDGRIIKPNQEFMAFPHEIPQAFRDVVKPIEPLPEEPPLEVATGGYEVRSVGPGWYAVFDVSGKRVNDKGLRQAEAQALLEELQG